MTEKLLNRWGSLIAVSCLLSSLTLHAEELVAPAQPEAKQPDAPLAPPAVQPMLPQPVEVAQPISIANETARYLAGLPLTPGSPLSGLAQDPRWPAHARAMNSAFSTLEQRQLSNIRIFRSSVIAPATQLSQNCVYLFSGPDFLYADAMFSDCSTFVLQGLEPVEPIPDLLTVPQAALMGTLQNIENSLNTILNFSFFKTKDMRQDFQRSQLKGILPIIYVFLARTGKEVLEVKYVSLDRDGKLLESGQGPTRGVKIAFADPSTHAQKTVYYFTSDLSDDALKKNPGVLRFCETLAPFNALLKAASYLMHEGGFGTVRTFLLQNSSAVLEDDSGIPIRYFTPDRWTPRFFGVYNGPIDLFKNYFQSDLKQYFAASAPKPLTFGFGYRWSSRSSTMILATRKP